MNLSELTPDEQRARIEEIWENRFTAFITMDELQSILTLALAAVPKISWVETDSPGEEWRAYVYGFELNVSLILNVADEWEYAWAVTSAYEVANQGTAPSLEAAQAAAEAALLKLIGGGE